MKACDATEVAAALDRVAAAVRSFIPQVVRLEPDGSGSPQMLALRNALMAFPAPAEVLFIDTAGFANVRAEGPTWTLLRFDLSKPGTPEVKFVGTAKAADLTKHVGLLEEHFGFAADSQTGIYDLTLVSAWYDHRFTFLAPYDIRTQPEEYGRELARHISMGHRFIELFLRETDFNAKYGLELDRVLPDSELLRFDNKTGEYLDCSYQRFSLRERQEHVAGIQPIPQVPESVKLVIDRAKRLYIFGHFEYSFFTIAKHYAYLALESALLNRWKATLPIPTVLRYQKEEVTVQRTGHRAMREFCKGYGWNIRKVFVNGRQFPFKAGMVVDWLRDDGVITDWQKWRFNEVYLKLRNSYSHLEFCGIDQPGAGTIANAVEEINTLFDSLPIGFCET
jgi:hypothetical protein